ncbi:MAG: biliverdin-producing heme oxygenase [Methylobacter sp.]|nr:biliverdin-producing heme oxygenase [Methylobacter sp.]
MVNEQNTIANKKEISSIRMLLRHATLQYHVQLNHHPLLVGITQTNYNLANYHKLLFSYFHLYKALESLINDFLGRQHCVFDYDKRNKLAWLIDDLAYMHLESPQLSCSLNLSALKTVGQLVGVLYVIEGSTLGGQMISRSLNEHHGLTRKTGARFFFGYGENTAIMWQNFIDFADCISGDEIQCRAAENAACQTFQLFNQVLDNYVQQEHAAD